MNHPLLSARALGFALALALGLVACGPPQNRGDAGAEAGPPRNDLLNINCTSAAGDEAAVPCNQRLMAMEMGATFFVGSRAQCAPNPNSPACGPVCNLADSNPENCTFTTAAPGCRYNDQEGYVVVVQAANGRRWHTAVGAGEQCPSPTAERRRWARVGFEDLRGAAACAREIPMGGYDDLQFTSCPTPMAACGGGGDAGVRDGGVRPNTCQRLNFVDGMMRMYMANVCTRTCGTNSECGNRGSCVQGFCWERCGGTCGLSCPEGFGCQIPMGETEGICLPAPPQS